MIARTLAAAALLLVSAPALAQSEQEQLDARYDRALAAGYKALMLCGAIGHSEAAGAPRTPESVAEWELAGIKSPLDAIVPELEFAITRATNGALERVAVDWAADMPPRFAVRSADKGCRLYPVGTGADQLPAVTDLPAERRGYRIGAMAGFNGLFLPWESYFDGSYGTNTRTTAVEVYHDGASDRRYADGFGPGTPQRTWSVAKSLAATLVGAAVQRGEARVGLSAGLGESELDPRRAITVDHLLRMASGRYSDTPGNRTDPLYWGGATVEEAATDWPLVHEPGTVFRYANNDTLMAVRAMADDLEEHPPAELFAQLGMTRTVAEADWRGDYILSSQVWTTAPDLLKFGRLYLDDGKLPDGTRILPEGWVEYVSTPSGPQPEGPFGYGAGFWLLDKSEGVPPDTFAAFGNRGQYVVIVPSREVVIVRRGEDPVGARFDIAAFTRDVLANLDE